MDGPILKQHLEVFFLLETLPVVGPFVLMNRSCTCHIAASFWRTYVVQAVEEMDNKLRK
jgi:hypothetical protein